MDALNSWDVALFAVAGYIAIMSLVRLMLGRRSALARQIQEDMERRESQAQQLSEEAEQDQAAQLQRASLAKKKA
jgi:hypothetical protein